MTTNTGVRICDKTQIRKWADERAEQDASAAPLIIGDDTDLESSDLGRDLARWPRRWYVGAALLVSVGAALGVIVVLAELLGPRW